MKRTLALILAIILAFALCACGEKPEEEGEIAQMVNPMVSVDRDGFMDGIGVYPPVPVEAEDLSHFIINGVLGEVQFTFDEHEYAFRVQKTDKFADISGMYFSVPMVVDMDSPCTVTVEEDGSMACAAWYDEGCSYAVCTKGSCDTAAFENMLMSIWR